MDTGVEADGWATRWVEPLADLAAGTTTALVPDVIVTALALGLTHRYVGRTVATDVHGVPVRATVRSVQVRRRRAHLQSRVELAAVDWGGRRVDEVTVVAHGVRVVPGLRTFPRGAEEVAAPHLQGKRVALRPHLARRGQGHPEQLLLGEGGRAAAGPPRTGAGAVLAAGTALRHCAPSSVVASGDSTEERRSAEGPRGSGGHRHQLSPTSGVGDL